MDYVQVGLFGPPVMVAVCYLGYELIGWPGAVLGLMLLVAAFEIVRRLIARSEAEMRDYELRMEVRRTQRLAPQRAIATERVEAVRLDRRLLTEGSR